MGKLIGKIVLTGGPCAGKTTALSKIEDDLTEKGYRVFVVGESATELIKGGIRPFGTSAIDFLKFQEMILKYQINKENIYEQAVKSLPDSEKCVIIFDRGLIDNKAYINNEQFSNLLLNMNLSELEVMDNYDMVIHLVTAANGKEENYTLENNCTRTETISEAIALDNKTVNAWVGHNNLRIIDNSTEFEEKLNRVLDNIHNLLGNPISLRQQRKYLVDLKSSDLSFLTNENCTKIFIEQIYLKSSNSIDDYERRLRKRTYKGEETYYFTTQSKEKGGISKVITDKKISCKEYQKILSMYDKKYMVSKERLSFTLNNQYFKLDIFNNDCSFAILEIEPTKENQSIIIPTQLCVIDDVTENPLYQNSNIAISKEEIKNCDESEETRKDLLFHNEKQLVKQKRL